MDASRLPPRPPRLPVGRSLPGRRAGSFLALALCLVLGGPLLLSRSPASAVGERNKSSPARRLAAQSGASEPVLAAGGSADVDSSGTAGGLRLMLVGHELSLTGAPMVLLELALQLRQQGHAISFLFLRDGPLEAEVRQAGFDYRFIADVQFNKGLHSEPVDPALYDVIVVNTVVLHPWVRAQVEAWGLAFMRKVVWWVHELPKGDLVPKYTDGGTVQRHLLARAAAVVFDSEASRQFWEDWVLQEAYWLGLDYSALIGRQESFERGPPLPAALPSMQTVRLALPVWMPGDHQEGLQVDCSRDGNGWPHAALRSRLRSRINATDADYVLLMVGTHAPHKGTTRLIQAFARAWRQANSNISGAGVGRLLLVCVGTGMPQLQTVVQQQWHAIWHAAAGAAPAAPHRLLEAVHLFDAVSDPEERLGWYAAADAQVVNSECENFGRVTLEGMAMSLPLLATACGGSKEIICDGVTGLLHPPPSTGVSADVALVQNILKLDPRTAAGRQLALQLGAAGCRRAAADFLPHTFLASFHAILQQVAAHATAADVAAEQGAGQGLSQDAAAGLTSGWAAAFMPEPRLQAKVKAAELSWNWEELQPAPFIAYESFATTVGSSLYNLGGYSGANEIVLSGMRRLDLESLEWLHLNDTQVPADLPETHSGAALLGQRHVYLATGQKGAACSGATTTAYRLDMHTLQFSRLPPTPQPRYAPQLVRLGGRLHLFGGLQPDRKTPARGHWSLALYADGSTEDTWQAEALLPPSLGGSHSTSMELQPRGAAEPSLYIWSRTSQEYGPRGAAQGDYMCALDREWGDVALWSFSAMHGWRRHRDLPLPLQHATRCTVKLGRDAALVVGGQHYDRWLSRTIWLFNATEDSWTRVGHIPVFLKGHVCTLYKGRLIMSGGQHGAANGADPMFGPLTARQFVAQLPPELLEAASETQPLADTAR